MAWRQPDEKPLPETILNDAYVKHIHIKTLRYIVSNKWRQYRIQN